ncbi:hypothetical protein [Blastococcus sp. TF02A-26]|uniref:AMIN-like domain-containing (lipo)protein n=1 Tax=Blastococcus sp. TF02A-26 TaxID=2250577 RepID=UPI000DE9D8A5|nr:hypothetical protein [Blastococcus sp. TF02A-26]RBY86096.1 hypothetical protein DQ240_09770 [Blastococcus sp. TF02A-26]
MSQRSRTVRRLAVTLAGGAVLGVTTLAAPASAAPGCSTAWGSLPESAGGTGAGTVDEIRTGRHACFDRLVVDIDGANGSAVGYGVDYVPQFREDGTGDAVPLRGAADLQIVVARPAHAGGTATYDPVDDAEAEDVSGYRTFRQVAWGQSFEGQSTIGLGVRARLPYRVSLLAGPGDDARLVVDVAHSW